MRNGEQVYAWPYVLLSTYYSLTGSDAQTPAPTWYQQHGTLSRVGASWLGSPSCVYTPFLSYLRLIFFPDILFRTLLLP